MELNQTWTWNQGITAALIKQNLMFNSSCYLNSANSLHVKFNRFYFKLQKVIRPASIPALVNKLVLCDWLLSGTLEVWGITITIRQLRSNCITCVTIVSSNLSTLEHSPITHHPTAMVFSLVIISFSISASSLILSAVLQPLLSLCCTIAFWNERKRRPPSVCSSS